MLIFRLFLFLFLAYILVLFGYWFLQDWLIFKARKHLNPNEKKLDYPFEDIYLQGNQGLVHGRYYFQGKEKACVFFCHGSASNLSNQLCLDTISFLQKTGIAVLIFDYPGFGKSDGKESEHSMYESAELFYVWLCSRVSENRIFILGRSLGGACAAKTAAKYSPGGLILESTFTSLLELAYKEYPWLPSAFLLRYRFPTIEFVRNLKVPLLVLHSVEDELIPFTMAQELAKAHDSAKVVEMRGNHAKGFLFSKVIWTKEITTFILQSQKVLSDS